MAKGYKTLETYYDRHPPVVKYTKRDFRKNNLGIYSTGNCHLTNGAWYVRLILSGNNHGLPISDTFKSKKEAEEFADRLADYMADYFVVREIKSKKLIKKYSKSK